MAIRNSFDTTGDRPDAGARARGFFDDLWTQGDYWELETSAFEQANNARALALLHDRRYSRVLEIGCGAGAFTRLLAEMSGHVLALDVSAVAIERARRAGAGSIVEFRVANIMEADPESEGPWDLVVISETIYYLGWLYTVFDVGWLGQRLFAATRDGGRVLMANSFGDSLGRLLHPSLIRTYRDLFVNVGFRLEREEIFRGTKTGMPIDALISLYQKPSLKVGEDPPAR